MLDEALAAVCAGEVTDSRSPTRSSASCSARASARTTSPAPTSGCAPPRRCAARCTWRTMAASVPRALRRDPHRGGAWVEAERELLTRPGSSPAGTPACTTTRLAARRPARPPRPARRSARAARTGSTRTPTRPTRSPRFTSRAATSRWHVTASSARSSQPGPAGGHGPLLPLLVDVQLADGDVDAAPADRRPAGGLAQRDTPTDYLVASAALARGQGLRGDGVGRRARPASSTRWPRSPSAEMPVELARARLELAGGRRRPARGRASPRRPPRSRRSRSSRRRATPTPRRALLRRSAPSTARGRRATALTRREAEVLELLGDGLTQRRDRRPPVHQPQDRRAPRRPRPGQARACAAGPRRPPTPPDDAEIGVAIGEVARCTAGPRTAHCLA